MTAAEASTPVEAEPSREGVTWSPGATAGNCPPRGEACSDVSDAGNCKAAGGDTAWRGSVRVRRASVSFVPNASETDGSGGGGGSDAEDVGTSGGCSVNAAVDII